MVLGLQIIVIALMSYIIGSSPNAYLVARYIRKINVFEIGSGNMGGTNVARAMGMHWGVLTVALDALKGVVAVVIAQLILPSMPLLAGLIASVGVIAGHNWSLFATWLYTRFTGTFQIRGGKGAATALGTMFMMIPATPVMWMLIIGVACAVITRFASLSVLLAFTIALTWTLIWTLQDNAERSIYIPYVTSVALLIVWRFRENIQRLLTGTERRLGERAT